MLTDGSTRRTWAWRVTIAGRSVPVPALLGAVATVVVAVWWLWPTITGADDDLDVLVVADGMLADARRPIEQRIREAGLSIEWYEASDWCDDVGRLADVIDEMEPGRVVLAFDDGSRMRRDRGSSVRQHRHRGGSRAGSRTRPHHPA